MKSLTRGFKKLLKVIEGKVLGIIVLQTNDKKNLGEGSIFSNNIQPTN
jgi:hypothetical protein